MEINCPSAVIWKKTEMAHVAEFGENTSVSLHCENFG